MKTNQARVRHALAAALALDRVYAEESVRLVAETVDVHGAAALLHTTPRAIYVRNQRGQMPPTIPGARRLLWRKADLLAPPESRRRPRSPCAARQSGGT